MKKGIKLKFYIKNKINTKQSLLLKMEKYMKNKLN